MLKKEDCIRIDKIFYKGSKYPQKLYVFECTDCGKELKIQSGGFKTHSCRCRRCAQLGKPYMFIYNELKTHRNSKVDFSLTYSELVDIIETNEGCHYCDSKLEYHKHSKVYGKNNSRAHHLDRKDNSLGYSKNNVVPCCLECNRLKSDRFSYEEFMKLSPVLKEIMSDRKNNLTLSELTSTHKCYININTENKNSNGIRRVFGNG